ncbi:MmpS family membrane protein [Mycobacterium tuberculosis]|nr:MmpS family membrane protein [Mycobacterium tuberculosis]CML10094.1 MmpS family membrane protein [Mycobacterium tuberculosis]CNW88480.1 MmpS family membrane protein [Mycobacterium tuberculosis]CNX31628.1 MmpS family membrane protein [Mycobacterium tuberculosis]CNX41118.1 MmpS family membrane protein [Mycobacterium tuberculosis]
MVSVHAGEGVVFSRSGRGTCRLNPCCVQIVNRPGMSGDSSSWKGWGHVRWFIEEVPAGAA